MSEIKKLGDVINVERYKPKESILLENESSMDNSILIETSSIQRMYSTVYHGLTTRFDLNPTESLIIATIYSLSKKYKYCDASQGTLAKTIGVCTLTIKTVLDDLQKRKLIERSKMVGRWRTYGWRISKEVEEYIEYLKQQIETKRKTKK